MDICVFSASSDRLDRAYFDLAYSLGQAIAKAGHRMVYGAGAGGLMGRSAQGVIDGGGELLGIAPRFFDEPGILIKEHGQLIFTDTMAERKEKMRELSQAFIALPGGIGTFEEFFETLTLKQLGRHEKPMILLDCRDYYGPFQALMEHTADEGFMSRACLELYERCQDPEQAVALCAAPPKQRGSIQRLSDYNR